MISVFTFFCFSQTNSKELTSNSLGYNNYPKRVELNNNTILKFNNEGYLIKKKETNGIDFFIIENLFDGELLTCSKTYMNNDEIVVDCKIPIFACTATANAKVEEEIKIVTYIAAEGDISTDLLSPGSEAHSRSDRELHGLCMMDREAQEKIKKLKN